MKRVVCLLLSLILMIGIITGCSSSKDKGGKDSNNTSQAEKQSEQNEKFNKTGYPIMNEPVEVTMMHAIGSHQGPWEDMHYFKAIEKATNIKIKFLSIESSGYEEKKNLAFASGDIPDVVWGLTSKEEIKYGVEGKTFIPLQDYIKDYAPNYAKMIKEYPDVNAVATSMDGNMYSFPVLANTLTMASNYLYMRTDWLDKVGKEIPKTVDEYIDVCAAIRAWDDTKTPVSCAKQSFAGLVRTFLPAFGYLVDDRYGLDETDQVVFTPSTEQYKLVLTFLNKLYTNKYLDNECFTQDDANVGAKMKENVIMMSDWGSVMRPENFENGVIQMTLLAPLTSEYYDKKHVRAFDMIFSPQIALTTSLKYPEAMVRWIDINYSDEDVAPNIVKGLNRISIWLGIEGQDWQYTDDAKTTYARIVPSGISVSEIEYAERHVSPGWGPCKLIMLAMPEKEKNPGQYMKASESKVNHFPYMEPGFKNNYLKYTPEEQDRLKILENDIESYTKQMEAKFITGQESFENWDKFAKKLEEMGVDELIKIKQDAYERYKLLLK